MIEKVHISKIRCWSCVHLQRSSFGGRDYKCIKNRVISEYEQPNFAIACADYKPRQQAHIEKKEAQKK